MELTVATCNLEGALSDEGRWPTVVRSLDRLQPDVAVLTKAFYRPDQQYLQPVSLRLAELGYASIHCLYQERGDTDEAGVMLAARTELLPERFNGGQGALEIVRLAGRKAVRATLQERPGEPVVRVVGLHFDEQDEARRCRQALALVQSVGNRSSVPTVLAGCMAAMQTESPRAGLVRATETMARHLPGLIAGRLPWKLDRLRALANMADSDVLAYLASNGYHEASSARLPTTPARLPLVQPDHIVANGHLQVRSASTKTLKNQRGQRISPHRWLSVRLRLAEGSSDLPDNRR